jgi:phage repressor protein C with HTH and peptisase S24 domain
MTKQAKPRWPSTESLAKILTATDTRFEDFVGLMSDRPGGGRSEVATQRLRCVPIAAAEERSLFDESGFPTSEGWDEIEFPGLIDDATYALEVQGSGHEPIYRDGDILVLSPKANIRRHDRVALKAAAGDIALGVLDRRTAQRIELRSFGRNEIVAFAVAEVVWLSRVIWASQ